MKMMSVIDKGSLLQKNYLPKKQKQLKNEIKIKAKGRERNLKCLKERKKRITKTMKKKILK